MEKQKKKPSGFVNKPVGRAQTSVKNTKRAKWRKKFGY